MTNRNWRIQALHIQKTCLIRNWAATEIRNKILLWLLLKCCIYLSEQLSSPLIGYMFLLFVILILYSIYYIFKKHALLASCSQLTHSYLLSLMQLKSSCLEGKGATGKVHRCILGKCSVLLGPPTESIFCQINMTKKTNVLVAVLPPCSSESLLCSVFRRERPTSRSKTGEIFGG